MIAAVLQPIQPGPLPGGLAGPLHFPSAMPWTWSTLALLLVMTLLWWLWRRLRRRAAAKRPRPAPAERPAPPWQPAIVDLIASIRGRHLQAKSYRSGCHELSGAMRSHWERGGLEGAREPALSRMTAREVAELLGDRPATRLLGLLSELQFGRRPPSQADFLGACELASDVATRKGGG